MTWRIKAAGFARPASGVMRRQDDGGFTLIELLVVIAILGLAIGMAASFIPRRNTRLELSNAASLVADGLRGARARAITHAAPVLVSVDADGLHIDGALRTLPHGIALSPGAVRFAPDGSATPATFRVTAPGVALPGYRITVEWITGRVAVADAS